MKTVIAASCLLFAAASGVKAAPPSAPYPITLEAGSAAEQAVLTQGAASTRVNGARTAEIGQAWGYRFAVNPGESCLLSLIADAALAPGAAPDPSKPLPALPSISATGPDGKPLTVRVTRAVTGAVQAAFTVPDNMPMGSAVTVIVTAKTDPLRVTRTIFSVRSQDRGDGTGLPVAIQQLLLQGAPAGTRISATPGRQTDKPYTALQTPRPPEPQLEVPVDALFVYNNAADAIQGWKLRGYDVWTMGGSRSDKAYADQHKDEMQVREDGLPRIIDGSFYLTPSPNRNAIERGYYDTALNNGSAGICPEEPEFFADAGYSEAFKRAWKATYHTDWVSPASSIDAAYRSAQLMASMETEHISSVVKAAEGRSGVRRMVALHSPINYAMWSIIAPQYAITSLPQVQDVIGQVWTGTARSAVRYAGLRGDRTFSTAYLEYSSLYHLTRGTSKRMWFLMDPLEDDPTRAQSDYKSHYEQTLIAALLFPDVDSYEVMPWPDRIFGHIPPEYAVEINSAVAALQMMHEQKPNEGSPAAPNIGVFVSDSMQYQRSKALRSDFDGVFGLTLPLLERGVPVQAISLDRATDSGYLKPFKTLLYTADYQKPTDARTHAAMADWVKRGGTLIVAGGSDPGNGLADAWWTKSGFKSPLDDLWQKLGINPGAPAKAMSAPLDDGTGYESIVKTDGSVHDLKNRNKVSLDLTRFCADTGSVAIRFTDATPADGWGPYLYGAELRVNGQLAASFAAGSDLESRFMVSDHGSEFNGDARYADKNASFTYQFDNIPFGAKVEFVVDIANGYAISASPAEPIFGHTLLSTGASGALKKAFPRLRIGVDYPATVYPGVPAVPAQSGPANSRQASGPPTPLYTLRSGGTPVWMQKSGDGLVIYAGVAPGFFTASSRSAGLLRALVQYGHQRAGGQYREPGALRLRRGKFSIIHTFQAKEQVEGRTIDVLSPSLNVAEDRVIPPNSDALLYDIGDEDDLPHIGYVSGRVEAKVEAPVSTSFLVRGPLKTMGVARLHSGGHPLAGVKGFDRLGRPVEVKATAEGNTLLLQYPNDPDGVVVRVGWKLDKK